MPESPNAPPPVLAFARVVAYAILTSAVRYSGHSSLFVDGKELGPVPRLAICQSRTAEKARELDATFELFHCDDEWNVLGIGAYPSIEAAKARAERIYAGVSACWVDPQVTEADAARYIEQECGHERCRFCGRLPVDVERLVVHERGGPICGACIAELHAFVNDDAPPDQARPGSE